MEALAGVTTVLADRGAGGALADPRAYPAVADGYLAGRACDGFPPTAAEVPGGGGGHTRVRGGTCVLARWIHPHRRGFNLRCGAWGGLKVSVAGSISVRG